MMGIWSDHSYSSANALRCAVSACAYLPTHTNTWDNSSPTCGCAVCRPHGRIGDRTDGVSRLPQSCNRVAFKSGWIPITAALFTSRNSSDVSSVNLKSGWNDSETHLCDTCVKE